MEGKNRRSMPTCGRASGRGTGRMAESSWTCLRLSMKSHRYGLCLATSRASRDNYPIGLTSQHCSDTPPQCKAVRHICFRRGRPVAGDRCSFFGEHASTDDAGFLSFAESLPTDDIASVLHDARTASTHRYAPAPSNQWRRFEKLKNRHHHFITIGDGCCSFNRLRPRRARRRNRRLLCAATVEKHTSLSGLPRRFTRRRQRLSPTTGRSATGGDFCYPGGSSRSPSASYRRAQLLSAQSDCRGAARLLSFANTIANVDS